MGCLRFAPIGGSVKRWPRWPLAAVDVAVDDGRISGTSVAAAIRSATWLAANKSTWKENRERPPFSRAKVSRQPSTLLSPSDERCQGFDYDFVFFYIFFEFGFLRFSVRRVFRGRKTDAETNIGRSFLHWPSRQRRNVSPRFKQTFQIRRETIQGTLRSVEWTETKEKMFHPTELGPYGLKKKKINNDW